MGAVVKGEISNGILTITLDLNHERLDAPPENGEPRVWLACGWCGKLEAVDPKVVAFLCVTCTTFQQEGYTKEAWLEEFVRPEGCTCIQWERHLRHPTEPAHAFDCRVRS